jgi:RNA polymerase sigma factor (TIGR02999 family)
VPYPPPSTKADWGSQIGHGREPRRICVIPEPVRDVTALLKAWGNGEEAALDELVPLVHGELRRIAGNLMRGERAGRTLQATALVNEAYLRLIDLDRIDWQNRVHFLSMAARVMRRVLVDVARERLADKRGGDLVKVTLDEALVPGRGADVSIIKLDDALKALAAVDERKSRVLELRFFAGLSVEETAESLGVSSKTVARDWDFARAWLRREMRA